MINIPQPKNPFKRIRYIPTISETIKVAYTRSQKAHPKKLKKKLSREEKIAIKEQIKITTFVHEINVRLKGIIKQFPSTEQIHPFYYDLLEITGKVNKIKQILGRLEGISKQIIEIQNAQLEKLHSAQTPVEFAQIRKQTIGRIISLVSKAKGDVQYLTRIVKKLKSVPDFNVLLPTIVVSGAPNVGKSSLVRAISTGTPEIGEFPFTTKSIVFGHRDVGFLQVQVVDTPGILDRPFKERNFVELQSIVAIKNIADIIVFMFDGASNASLSISEQLNLLDDIEKEFGKLQIVKVLNKIDLLDNEKQEKLKKQLGIEHLISTKTHEGLADFIQQIEEAILELIHTAPKFQYLHKMEIAEEFKSKQQESFSYRY
ncbi:MAG: NOG1 family protein [Candidatus Heimdallarchaeaceae archaeon]